MSSPFLTSADFDAISAIHTKLLDALSTPEVLASIKASRESDQLSLLFQASEQIFRKMREDA